MTSAPRPGPDARRTRDGGAVLPAVALAAGVGATVALQGRVNGDLAEFGAGAVLSGWVSYVGTLAAIAGYLLLAGRARAAVATLRRSRPWWYLIGLCGIPIVLAFAAGIPLVGVAVASVCSVAGQTVTGLGMDSRGIGIPSPLRLTPLRLLAGAVALGGLLVAVAGSTGVAVSGWGLAGVGLALFAGGSILCVQTAGTGRLTGMVGDPFLPALTAVIGGTVGISVILAVQAAFGGLSGAALPGLDRWWLYLGGPLGAIITVASAWAVRRLGVFALTLSIVGGQMVMALVLDALGPIGVTLPSVLAAAVVSGAVVLAMPRRRASAPDSPDTRRPSGVHLSP